MHAISPRFSLALAAVAGGLGVALSGPVADSIGVLNNLDTLAWVPWLWAAVLTGKRLPVALIFAAAVLGAEPQLAGIAAVGALLLAPTRATIIGLCLGIGLVAVQITPFLFWVMGGDRGLISISGTPSGALEIGELPGIVFPDFVLSERPDRFLHNLFVPMWVVVLGLAGTMSSVPLLRKLARFGLVLGILSVVASLPVGHTVWTAMTLGMVRFPARLIFLSVVALAPVAAVGLGQTRLPARVVAPCVGLALFGCFFLPFSTLPAVVGICAAGWVLAGPAPAVAALVGSIILVVPQMDVLELKRPRGARNLMCGEALAGARVYTLEPSWDQFAWVAEEPDGGRGVALAYGYSGLLDGRRLARTFAPLKSRALAEHLRAADQGPSGRWWLDSLAAPRIAGQHVVPGFPELCREGGLYVFENSAAWPIAAVLREMPKPGETPFTVGRIEEESRTDDWRRFRITVGDPGGVLVVSETPDPGWRFFLDGLPAAVVQGPGILHGVAVPEGEHVVEARCRPAGFAFGATVSVISALVFFLWLYSDRNRRAAG